MAVTAVMPCFKALPVQNECSCPTQQTVFPDTIRALNELSLLSPRIHTSPEFFNFLWHALFFFVLQGYK